jgi:hypothetical protein
MRRDNGAMAALAAVAALTGAALVARRRSGGRNEVEPSGDTEALGDEVILSRDAVITAEILFEDYNAEEDLGNLQGGDEADHLADCLAPLMPGPIEVVVLGRKKLLTSTLAAGIDHNKVYDRYFDFVKELKKAIGAEYERMGNLDDYWNFDVTFLDRSDDIPSILSKVHENASSSSGDRIEVELYDFPYYTARDWRLYPDGFSGREFIPVESLKVVNDRIYKTDDD